MGEIMQFPETVEEFMQQYKITDTQQVYTNGTELVPIFRMKQWFEAHRNHRRRCVPLVDGVRCFAGTNRDGGVYGNGGSMKTEAEKPTYLDCWHFIAPLIPVTGDEMSRWIYVMTYHALNEAEKRRVEKEKRKKCGEK